MGSLTHLSLLEVVALTGFLGGLAGATNRCNQSKKITNTTPKPVGRLTHLSLLEVMALTGFLGGLAGATIRGDHLWGPSTKKKTVPWPDVL